MLTQNKINKSVRFFGEQVVFTADFSVFSLLHLCVCLSLHTHAHMCVRVFTYTHTTYTQDYLIQEQPSEAGTVNIPIL